MRSEQRIDLILTHLSKIWHRYPDWRFFQLVSNLSTAMTKNDPFYIEDTEFLRFLMEVMKEDDDNASR